MFINVTEMFKKEKKGGKGDPEMEPNFRLERLDAAGVDPHRGSPSLCCVKEFVLRFCVRFIKGRHLRADL